MKKYHITWFETQEDLRSKGENFEANSPDVAILSWSRKYPNTIFLSCVSMEVLNYGDRKGVFDQITP